ncbi:Uncharacterised protein [Mycobacteroides abscessus subsp. abscessus]|nr:Uncharacterised protein [Mycobacteroides abscessus subsp. abscessus]
MRVGSAKSPSAVAFALYTTLLPGLLTPNPLHHNHFYVAPFKSPKDVNPLAANCVNEIRFLSS